MQIELQKNPWTIGFWKMECSRSNREKIAQKEDVDRTKSEVKNAKKWGENLKDEGSYETWNVWCSIDKVKNNYFFIY